MNSSNLTLVDIWTTPSTIPLYIFFYIVLFALSAIVGVIGNILVLLAGLTSRILRNMRNAFIFNLALADLCVSAVTMPMSIIGVLMGKPFFDHSTALCMLSAVVCAPGCLASTFSICWIAVSRYYYICQYVTYLKHFTVFRLLLYVASIWVFSFAAHLPNHAGWGNVRYSNNFQFCTFDSEHISYSLFYASCLFIAIAITAIFYVKLYLKIRTSDLPRRLLIGKRDSTRTEVSTTYLMPSGGGMSFKDEIRLVRASFKIFVIFLIFWAPVTVLILMAQGDAVPDYLYLYSALAAHSNSTLNVFVYYFENHAFRRAILKVFCRQKSESCKTDSQSRLPSRSQRVLPSEHRDSKI